jgi:hypothetical protein
MRKKKSILVRVDRPLISLLLVTVGCAFLIVGCGQPPSATSAPPPQTPPPAAPTTAPQSSALLIDGQMKYFGPAFLRLTATDGKVEARLYSNEPAGVLSGQETVDSYDFDMVLPDISDPAQIDQAVWTAKSPSSQFEDSPYGIFLNQQKKILQPMDVNMQFVGQVPHIRVIVQGMFWLYRTTQDSSLTSPPPEMVRVIGSLETTAIVK